MDLEKELLHKFVENCILCKGSGLPIPFAKNDTELAKLIFSPGCQFEGCYCGHCSYWYDLLGFKSAKIISFDFKLRKYVTEWSKEEMRRTIPDIVSFPIEIALAPEFRGKKCSIHKDHVSFCRKNFSPEEWEKIINYRY